MTQHQRLRAPLLGAAILLCIFGVLLAGFGGSLVSAIVISLAVVPISLALALERQPAGTPAALLEKIAQQAESGRKLAIYERETGLFAHWYITLRCDEECKRAVRYERPLALLLVEPVAQSNAWEVNDRLLDWLRRQLRATDLPGYLGNARYVVLMPETKPGQAKRAVKRLLAEVDGSEAGLSCYPEDGDSFNALLSTATNRLTADQQAA